MIKELINSTKGKITGAASEKKKGAIIMTSVVSAAVILALIIGILAVGGRNAKAPVTDDSISQRESESVSETESETESERETETETESETEPETQTETETVPITPSYREIGTLDEATVEYLMSLDNTTRGWGQGVNFDEKNRPGGAVWAQNTYGVYGSRYIMEDENKIYLTFDEGYENGYTPKILDALKAKGVKAVFFVTLPYVKSCPDLVRRMIDEGHIVGNHSTAHLSFPSMSLEDAYNDVLGLHNYMLQNFNYEMKYFRFPMGESSDRTQALLQKMGYTPLFWSYAYKDWDPSAQMSESEALQKVVERAHPGAIYLLHAVSSTNAAILEEAIDNFRAAGYELCLPES